MENSFSEKQSLELISQMISNAKNNLQKGNARVILLWGYIVAGISLATAILFFKLPEESKHDAFYLWFLAAAGIPFHFYLLKKISRENVVRTYIGDLMNKVWIGFTIAILLVVMGMLTDTLLVVFIGHPVKPASMSVRHFEFVYWFQWLLLTPFILCLYGFALFVSGKAYRFRPLSIGGLICFIGAFFLLAGMHHLGVYPFQQFVLFICAVAGFVVPGHLLNRKEKKDVQGS